VTDLFDGFIKNKESPTMGSTWTVTPAGLLVVATLVFKVLFANARCGANHLTPMLDNWNGNG
jgi:hypothetical protein